MTISAAGNLKIQLIPVYGQGIDFCTPACYLWGMSLYSRISEWSRTEWCCDERMAMCPECESVEICVFCADGCDECGLDLF